MRYILPSIRLWLVTMLICVVGYTALVFGFAQTVAPNRADGSMLTINGQIVGSALVAQDFTAPRYIWPRPSAAGYDAKAAMGSNLSPTSEKLTERAKETGARYGASAANPLPADLVAASGGGLDPHISLAGALYQAERVADARGMEAEAVRSLITQSAKAPGGPFAPEPIVNVLELNLALDRMVQ